MHSDCHVWQWVPWRCAGGARVPRRRRRPALGSFCRRSNRWPKSSRWAATPRPRPSRQMVGISSGQTAAPGVVRRDSPGCQRTADRGLRRGRENLRHGAVVRQTRRGAESGRRAGTSAAGRNGRGTDTAAPRTRGHEGGIVLHRRTHKCTSRLRRVGSGRRRSSAARAARAAGVRGTNTENGSHSKRSGSLNARVSKPILGCVVDELSLLLTTAKGGRQIRRTDAHS